MTGLRAAGYTASFTPLEEGVKQTFAEEPAI
jgi:ADP-L-glycero-D-manno-heptose 6-epimerase